MPHRSNARALLRSLWNTLAYSFTCALWVLRNAGCLRTRTGWLLIWGKLRRGMIVSVPGLAERLKRKHGLRGGCNRCGASCNLLMPCPQWDASTRLCRIYEDRPAVCRQFPITPTDLRDLALSSDTACGHSFLGAEKPIDLHRR